ncbi:MAG: glycosyltransferase, partial [Deltaproteobacteria bacterium]|nr:glycosyltransferase [Deltaproteobacteria bacterium]
MKLSIVIPVYNEKDTLEEIFRLVQLAPYTKEIIAVDDASTDGSRDILRRLAGEYEDVKVF